MDDAPRTDDPGAIARLRTALDAAGFTAEGVNELLGLEDVLDWDASEVPVYARLLSAGQPLSTLVALYLLGLRVEVAAAERALAPLSLDEAWQLGALRIVDGSAEAPFEIVPTDYVLLASDRREHGVARPDHVLGFVSPTRVLATLTVTEPVEAALDIGTGSGYQAMCAAPIAGRVVGVDVNARALRFAEFNAALNGVDNLELREGSLFDPVAGDRFGLVVCNPPYVISPETDYVFRDSGLPGDSFCEALVRELPSALAEGGHGVALIAWVHRRDEDPSAPVRAWVEGAGCDTLLLRYTSTTPLEYAAGWNRTQTRTPETFASGLERWTAYYDELGIEAISWGGLILRRRSAGGPNWFWHHRPASRRIGSASEQILRLFAAQDLLRAGDSRELLEARLALAGDHAFEQRSRLDDGAPDGEPTVLRLDGGLCFRMEVDEPTVALLSRLDGRRSVGDAVTELAAASTGVDPERLAELSLPGIRRLVELGFLVSA